MGYGEEVKPTPRRPIEEVFEKRHKESMKRECPTMFNALLMLKHLFDDNLPLIPTQARLNKF
jgi:hypothetical protein